MPTDSGDAVDIKLYECPGYGDEIDNNQCLELLKKAILNNHKTWKSLDAQSMTNAEFLASDERIHCIFYLISPSQLKSIDKQFLAMLGPLAPIIPIIAKADAMTNDEKDAFVSVVKNEIDEISKKMRSECVYNFMGDDVGMNSKQPNVFAVVCDKSGERAYPWGSLSIADPATSDFHLLRSLLFEQGLYSPLAIYADRGFVILTHVLF